MAIRYTNCMDRTRAKYGVRNGKPVIVSKAQKVRGPARSRGRRP